jgi:hypothetical protein
MSVFRGYVFAPVKLETECNQTLSQDAERGSDLSLTTKPTLKDKYLEWPSISHKFASFRDAIRVSDQASSE